MSEYNRCCDDRLNPPLRRQSAGTDWNADLYDSARPGFAVDEEPPVVRAETIASSRALSEAVMSMLIPVRIP